MTQSPSPLQIATKIHFFLLRELGQGIDVERMLTHRRYERDVLLVCEACKGTDLALLRADVPNERTLLLTGFFHCVRLTAAVADAHHPFHALFEGHMHLFLCNADGSGRVDLDGTQTQGQVHKAMRDVLGRDGKVDLDRAAGKLQQYLAQLDRLDEQEIIGLKALDAALERRGDQSSKVKALQGELQALGKERAAILDGIRKLGRRIDG